MAGSGRAKGKVPASDAAPEPRRHVPVLLAPVLASLAPKAGETYIDATFGAGGYTRAILEAADCRVLALERDPTSFFAGGDLVRAFGDRLILANTEFSRMEVEARRHGLARIDGVVMDIGVSSMQIDDPGRGFSFLRDGPLDMRMSQEGPSAATLVNGESEARLADILFHCGEERRARQIARAIVKAREAAPIATTRALVAIVEKVLGPPRGGAIHPATRTFQALRIAVNDELGELARGLAAAERLLAPGGRLVVVSFHSLEDRIVKRFLSLRSGHEAHGSRHLPPRADAPDPSFRIVNQRPLTPTDDELEVNPRSRSARLRAAVRTEAPAWPESDPAALGLPDAAPT